MSIRTGLLVTMGCGCFIALAAGALRSMPTRDRAPIAPLAAAVEVAPEPQSAPAPPTAPTFSSPIAAPHVEPGQVRVYDVTLAQDVTVGGDGGAVEQLVSHRLHATWSVTCIANEGGRIRYRAALSDVGGSSHGRAYAQSDVRRDFSPPFVFETDELGTVILLAFESGVGNEARGIVKTLVAGGQVVFSQGRSDGWTSNEADTTGEYEANYVREAAAHLKKTRSRYKRIATDSGLRDARELGEIHIDDDTGIDLKADCSLERLESKTATNFDAGQGLPKIRSQLRLSEVLRATRTEASRLGEYLDQGRHLTPVAVLSPPPVTDDPQAKAATQRRIDAAMVKKATIADLENELGATPSGSGRARGALMGRLGADFRLHPEDAEKAVAYARSAPVADGQAMAGALGGAGTAESMKALAEIANSSDAPKAVRVNAIGALALEQTPSSANVQALKTMSGDSDPEIASAATLALGAAARTVAGTDPVAYDDAVGALLADLANAQSAQEMILDLRALGNSGDPRVLGAAEQAMSVQDEGVRIAAVAAVRFVAGSACDDFLANAAQTDPDAAVRIQAIGTIQAYRSDVEYLPTFTSVMRNDPSPLVRRAVLQALNLIKTNPAATSLIAATARDDASEDVRQFAHAILDS